MVKNLAALVGMLLLIGIHNSPAQPRLISNDGVICDTVEEMTRFLMSHQGDSNAPWEQDVAAAKSRGDHCELGQWVYFEGSELNTVLAAGSVWQLQELIVVGGNVFPNTNIMVLGKPMKRIAAFEVESKGI